MKNLILAIISLVFLTGCSSKDYGSNKVKIGVIVPLSGSGAAYGKDALRGIEMATNEYNNSKSKVKIELIVEDNGTDSKKSVNAAQKLILVDGVKIILGPVTSSSTLAIAPICEANKVVCFSPGASSPEISQAGDYVFRNWISDDLEGKAMAKYVIRSDQKYNVAILYINNDYGIGLKDVFSKEFKSLGGEVVLELGYEQGETDFKTLVARLKQSKADIIYMPGYYKEMANILIQCKKNDMNLPIRSVVTFEEPEIFNLTKTEANGVVYSSPYYDIESYNDTIKLFRSLFTKEYKVEPGIFAAHGYDAVKLISKCLVYAESNKVKDCLYGIENYPGISGNTSFDENGDVVKPVAIKKVENLKFIVVELFD
jgi:branched-chain amino acid transport system substrate-binding protein